MKMFQTFVSFEEGKIFFCLEVVLKERIKTNKIKKKERKETGKERKKKSKEERKKKERKKERKDLSFNLIFGFCKNNSKFEYHNFLKNHCHLCIILC